MGRPAIAPGLTLAYLAPAVLAFAVAAAGVPWLAPELAGHYYHPRVLALTHTVTLGWVTLAIMGSSYQLIPIVLQRPVWSTRLARGQLAVMPVGIVGMISHFFIEEWSGLVWGAGLVTLGIAAHVVNVGLTLRGVRPWTFTSAMFVVALGGIAATAIVGFALGIDRIVPFVPLPFFGRLHAHFHLGLLGWIMPMVLGAGARVYPMFMHAPSQKDASSRAQFWGLACGGPLAVAGVALAAPAMTIAGALGVAVSVTSHLVALLGMMRARRRRDLDRGVRFVLTAAAFLSVAMLMGLGFALDALRGPRLGAAYAVLVLGGWVLLTIVGMMLKIVPFLVWYRVYAALAGRAPVPSLAKLSWPRAERCAYAFLTTGIPALAVAVAVGDARWIRAAGVLVTAGALAFALAIGAPLSLLGRRPARSAVGGRLSMT